MVPRSSFPTRLVPLALLFVVGSCSHSRPRPTLAEREARCAPVWKAVHAEIDARGAACSADWECREVRSEYLGCDAWANLGFKLSEGRIVELENACAPISFVPECGERVGACVAGRCTGRPTIRDAGTCRVAKQVLEKRLGEPTQCRSDTECSLVWAFGLRGVGPSAWKRLLASEVHQVDGSCRASDWDWSPAETEPTAACVDAKCAFGSPDSKPLVDRGEAKQPAPVGDRCLDEALRLPGNLTGPSRQAMVRFVVSERGVPFAFRFEGIWDRQIMYRIADDLSQCAFYPSTSGGEAIKGLYSYRLVSPP